MYIRISTVRIDMNKWMSRNIQESPCFVFPIPNNMPSTCYIYYARRVHGDSETKLKKGWKEKRDGDNRRLWAHLVKVAVDNKYRQYLLYVSLTLPDLVCLIKRRHFVFSDEILRFIYEARVGRVAIRSYCLCV